MLYEVITAPYSNWEDDGSNNRKAKESLSVLYLNLSKIKTIKQVSENFPFRYEYMHNLLLIKEAFDLNLYCRACHEIETFFHYHPFWEQHILLSLKKLIKKYLE